MTERLLQYIWQLQYYNQQQLCTVDGQQLTIISPGQLNTNQGPDFLDAKIKVGNTIWAGNIEIHILSSDWIKHKHQNDSNYQNVMLHVVWEDDAPAVMAFPVLELKGRIAKTWLNKYQSLMDSSLYIPCQQIIQQVPSITWVNWKERLLVERLEQKSALIMQHLHQSNFHWEEVFWWVLARNFGAKVNSESFEKIAHSLPQQLLGKHKNQIHQTEALLFGQAGLLQGSFNDSYPQMLQKEYRFLQKKYLLQPLKKSLHFLRMRPSNFPTIRLAQLAMLIHHSTHLFSKIKEISSVNELRKLLDAKANDYWHYHYQFDEESIFKKKQLGQQMGNNIIINTIVPMLFTYGLYHRQEEIKEKALQWLSQIAAEKNAITKGFETLGILNENAFDSQALIQLKNTYCNHKRCLACAVGNKLLKNFS